jgi:hypothetical protein
MITPLTPAGAAAACGAMVTRTLVDSADDAGAAVVVAWDFGLTAGFEFPAGLTHTGRLPTLTFCVPKGEAAAFEPAAVDVVLGAFAAEGVALCPTTATAVPEGHTGFAGFTEGRSAGR